MTIAHVHEYVWNPNPYCALASVYFNNYPNPFFASGIVSGVVILMPSSSCTPGDIKDTNPLLQSYSDTSQKQVNNLLFTINLIHTPTHWFIHTLYIMIHTTQFESVVNCFPSLHWPPLDCLVMIHYAGPHNLIFLFFPAPSPPITSSLLCFSWSLYCTRGAC